MGSQPNPWWSDNFPELVSRREPQPGVERWQTTYVRYRRFAEAQISQSGWDLATSRRNYEQLVRSEHQHFLPEDHLLFSGLAPEAISLRIIESPAEFAVPVKQDRRLSPNFRVRVEVKYRHSLSFPLTLKAYVVTQQEKDNILAWYPDDSNDPDKPQKKAVTDLKGTTCITHHFEATSNNGKGQQPQPVATFLQGGQGFPATTLGNPGLPGFSFGQQGGGFGDSREQRLLAAEVAANLYQQGGMTGMSGVLMDFNQLQGSAGLQPKPQQNGLALVNLGAQLWSQTEPELKVMEQMLLQQQQQKLSASQLFPGQHAALLPQQTQLMGAAGPPFNAFLQASSMQQLPKPEAHVLSQEFEFANLEFLKPTRMNKVYMLFACTVLDLDTMFVVYNIPTIGICRAEQREKACQKLGVPAPIMSAEAFGAVKLEENSNIKRQKGPVQAQQEADSDSEGSMQPMQQADVPPISKQQAGGAGASASAMEDSGNPLSRMAMRDFIVEEYENTGLKRKLSSLDMSALLSQAGFPCDASSDHAAISQGQWTEFTSQFRNVLKLLRQIASVWNLEDPCVISGFDMDRQGTVQALRDEPAGTFICRFSMSQPGCLVLTCKTTAGHPKADNDGLIHAIIRIDDLNERRVDFWIRDFAGATHVLDVYRQKRVDKRKVFASNYMRLKGLEMEAPPAFALDPSAALFGEAM